MSGRASQGGASDDGPSASARAPGKQTRSELGSEASEATPAAPVQRKSSSGDGGSAAAVHAAADVGFSGSSGGLPHQDAIQRSFGRHDISNVSSFTDTFAQKANRAMGAEGYASKERVAFAGSPDLHTAAHEAAHVVQQRKGLSLEGGVGRAGDRHEQAADAVADAVVRGDSAEALLDEGGAAGSSSAVASVQHKVPEPEQQSVTAHFNRLIALHELDEGAKKAELTSAIEECNTPQEAMARLDERLDPTAPLKALVRAQRFQAALEEVVRIYRPAAAVDYQVQATNDYAAVLPHGTPIPPGIPFGVVADGRHATGKQAIIYMHQHWIERWIMENQIGSLINTIEHESTHAGQKNSPATEFPDNTDVMEFEAYTHEILLVDHKAKSETSPLPTQAQLQKAYDAAKGHLAGLRGSIPSGKQPKYEQLWLQVEAAFPDLIAYLDRRDERRGASREEEQRFAAAVQKHAALGERLAKLEEAQESQYGDAFRGLEGEESTAYRQVLTAHQELHASAQQRVAGAYEAMGRVNDEFSRYRRNGPRRSRAAKPAKAQPSGSAMGFSLAPPPSGSGFGLLPPPSASGFSLAPPPRSEAQQKQAAELDDDFGDFADLGDFASAPVGAQPSAAPKAPEKPSQSTGSSGGFADFADFADFGAFQSGPAKKDDDDDFGDFGDFQSALPATDQPTS